MENRSSSSSSSSKRLAVARHSCESVRIPLLRSNFCQAGTSCRGPTTGRWHEEDQHQELSGAGPAQASPAQSQQVSPKPWKYVEHPEHWRTPPCIPPLRQSEHTVPKPQNIAWQRPHCFLVEP